MPHHRFHGLVGQKYEKYHQVKITYSVNRHLLHIIGKYALCYAVWEVIFCLVLGRMELEHMGCEIPTLSITPVEGFV